MCLVSDGVPVRVDAAVEPKADGGCCHCELSHRDAAQASAFDSAEHRLAHADGRRGRANADPGTATGKPDFATNLTRDALSLVLTSLHSTLRGGHQQIVTGHPYPALIGRGRTDPTEERGP